MTQTASISRRTLRDLPKHVVIILILGMQLLPAYMMFQISFKNNQQFISNPWLPPNPADAQYQNWVHAFWWILPYLGNTLFVALLGTVGALIASVLGAYFFGRYRMPFSRLLWAAFMFVLLMPTVVNIVPLFMQLRSMNLLNNLWALILVGIAGVQAYNLFLLRGFVEDIPKELFEAADIDGASHLRQVWHVVVPMSLPIIGTLAITTFLGLWNEFLLPLIVLRDHDKFTVGVGLAYLDGEYVRRWGHVMAAFVMASIPLVLTFIFTMRFFVRGLAAGAVKG